MNESRRKLGKSRSAAHSRGRAPEAEGRRRFGVSASMIMPDLSCVKDSVQEKAARRTREAYGGRKRSPESVGEARKALRKNLLRFVVSLTAMTCLLFLCFHTSVRAEPAITIDLNAGDGTTSFGTLDMLFLTTILALLPSILIMMTSFTRIIIVLSFLRNAMGTQQTPPNQVLVGLALFMTLFIMMPVINQINEEAYTPLKEGVITQEVALERASVPLKKFMLKQIYGKDLNLFLGLSQSDKISAPQGDSSQPQSSDSTSSQLTENASDSFAGEPTTLTQEEQLNLGMEVIIPSFITSELKRAFVIGFLLFIPFLIIDMVVSSTLMSMGMVMLPPSMIALPFKIMTFVLVDGWNLLIGNLISGFLK